MNMNSTQIIETIELLNYEGPVIKAHKLEDGTYLLADQWKTVIAHLEQPGIIQFLEGETVHADSKGTGYHYPSHHRDAKPSHDKLNEFLGLNNE